jgi:hypothetical protein
MPDKKQKPGAEGGKSKYKLQRTSGSRTRGTRRKRGDTAVFFFPSATSACSAVELLGADSLNGKNLCADLFLLFWRAEPENRGVFLRFRFLEFTIGADKNAVQVNGSGKANGICKGYIVSTLEAGGFPVYRLRNKINNLKRGIINGGKNFIGALKSIVTDKSVINNPALKGGVLDPSARINFKHIDNAHAESYFPGFCPGEKFVNFVLPFFIIIKQGNKRTSVQNIDHGNSRSSFFSASCISIKRLYVSFEPKARARPFSGLTHSAAGEVFSTRGALCLS